MNISCRVPKNNRKPMINMIMNIYSYSSVEYLKIKMNIDYLVYMINCIKKISRKRQRLQNI